MEGKKIEKRAEKGKKKMIVGTRGRTFQGYVVKKFDKRIVVDLERIVRVPKYERFTKKKTRIHARIPEGMKVSVGDYVKVRECRPLSKIMHFVVEEIVRSAEGESK